MDELIPYSPEPCETCDTGIGSARGYDHVYRCKNCVHQYAADQGWDGPATETDEPDTPPIKLTGKVKPASMF